MKPGWTKKFIGLTGWAGLCLAGAAYAPVATAKDAALPVSVGGYAQHAGDKIVYYYRVANNSPQSVAAVAVGRDRRVDGDTVTDIYELLERPSGWNPKFGIPTTSYNAPTGWRVSMATPAEDVPDSAAPDIAVNTASPDTGAGSLAVTWEPLNEKSPKLFAGQSMSKLSVTVDRADASYLTGHALISFPEGNPPSLVVPIERLDNTPPTLTVSLSPGTITLPSDTAGPESGLKPVPVKATFAVQDDFDRMPRIRLESITANETVAADDILDASPGLDDRYFKLRAVRHGATDRIYTVIYSATDATGNQTLASATVTVIAAKVTAPAAMPVKAPVVPALR
ncbi:MAG: hypothetical protein HY938_11175 [Nitrosomonadales bacterium]|nr:hypothetical protein [Nitrosomonadales bacterium]